MTSLLSTGRVEIEGRMPWSSNGTYLVTVTEADSGNDSAVPAIYKPGRAERPLWDFPDGLYRREVAAYELARALGWDLVPPTVEVEDAPLGPGSLQLFVDADFEQHYFTLLEDRRHHAALKRMAVFDVLANNADRKGGHCLLDGTGRIWGIDHGLCFHVQHKLRTVIWDFAGEPVGGDDLEAVGRLAEAGLPDPLRHLLHDEEGRALLSRARHLLEVRRLPQPRTDHPYPWPLV
ncbi:MAG TPA: SCO1664 family protein [Acidimicrobiales bacterium]|nr:SCO1664 family protein [Acidimicrobiales bacterium]